MTTPPPESQIEGHLLRVKTVDGNVQVFVRVDGRDHVIDGIYSVNFEPIELSGYVRANFYARLGGLGDQ